MNTMTTFQARYDGHVLIPQEPVDLHPGEEISLKISHTAEDQFPDTPLGRIAKRASKFEGDPVAPGDSACEHDHYLYKTPKRHQ